MRNLFILFAPSFWDSRLTWQEAALIPFLVVVVLGNLYMLYNQGIAAFGWQAPPRLPRARRERRFLVLVAAHNEESVIGDLLDSLNEQDYPRESFDVYVVADNCNDRTAEIAEGKGAVVFRRFNTSQRGKTWAIKDLLEWIKNERGVHWATSHYAVSIIDADNVVHPAYLRELNNHFDAHPDAEAVQGYVDTKNPNDNALTSVYALAYWSANPFWQWARYRLGLSAGLAGTGFAIRADTLDRIGWRPRSLTEDLEFTTQLVLEGKRIHWCEWAVIYDEKPLRTSVSFRQRTRWMQGHLWCLKTYGLTMLKAFLKTRKLIYFDMFLYLISPGKMMTNFIVVIGGYIWLAFYLTYLYSSNADFSAYHLLHLIWPLLAIMQTLNILIMAPTLHNIRHCGKRGREAITFKYVSSGLTFWLYLAMWMPIIIQALFKINQQNEWVKTPHNRKMAPRR